MTREQKIAMLQAYSQGIKPQPIPECRPEIRFTRIGDNQYLQIGKEEVVTLQDIDQMNEPYKQLTGQVQNWKEVKQYDGREEEHVGLPLLVQINVRGRDSNQPEQIILPAIRTA